MKSPHQTKKLYVYWLPNGDGLHEFIVAAENQIAACELMNTSQGSFRSYGGCNLTKTPRGRDCDEKIKVASEYPGVVFRRKLHAHGPNPWTRS